MRASERGFTLPEVVLVLVIAAVAVLPLGMLFANSSIRSGEAHNATVMAELAQAKMEEIAADKNSPSRGFTYLVAANYPTESPVTAFPGYTRSVAFAPDSLYDGVTFRTVSVTVAFASVPSVTLTTWFTNY
jgi:prepilin-type N-terminal cleavage/methylation domain-containing protein